MGDIDDALEAARKKLGYWRDAIHASEYKRSRMHDLISEIERIERDVKELRTIR
jgi:hypothetical protein